MKKHIFFILCFCSILIILCSISCRKQYESKAAGNNSQQGQQNLAQDEKDETGEKDNFIDGKEISWKEAKNHIGEILTVYGKVVSTYYYKEGSEETTHLYMGNPPPDAERLTLVIPGKDRINFPEPPQDYYYEKTIYVNGLIQESGGELQIEVNNPSQIRE